MLNDSRSCQFRDEKEERWFNLVFNNARCQLCLFPLSLVDSSVAKLNLVMSHSAIATQKLCYL